MHVSALVDALRCARDQPTLSVASEATTIVRRSGFIQAVT
ncbi:MAG: hypothetical protein OJF62_002677 [Pseudolabrys sp.]|jgi:hypothetical protein|nr:hypothetical protein [Pseudolabrys sp.]